MGSNITALVIHLLFFAIGSYVYLFARGIVGTGEGERYARAETFRQENATWMRYLGLAMAAVMLLNVMYDLAALIGQE